MTIQPKIQGFNFDSYERRNDGDDGHLLTVRINAPDGLVAATLLAHITALVSQYQSVQRQAEVAEQPESRESSTILDSASTTQTQPISVETQPQVATAPAAKTTTRKTPAKRKAAPPASSDAVVAAVAVETERRTALTAVPDPAPVEPTIVEKAPESAPTSAPTPAPVVEGSPTPTAGAVEPDGAGETCPPDIVTASSFRKVLEWMVAHNYTTVDMIVATCEKYESQSPAIARAKSSPGSSLTERVERGLRVIEQMGATA